MGVAALTYLGSVDPDPAFGCINTNGDLGAIVSGEPTVVYSRATAASPANRLLLRGCEARGDRWCVGAIHEDTIEGRVFDSRWLELSGDQGFVPIGRTVGPTLPDGARDDGCPGGVPPPRAVDVFSAIVDQRAGLVAVGARTEGAAFIGFALRRSDPVAAGRLGL